MKKVMLFGVLFFSNIIFLNAECSYKELKELNSLASHVSTHYDYNESTGKFSMTILNLPSSLFVTEGNSVYNSNGSEAVVTDLDPGTQFRATVVSSSSNNCSGKNLRSLSVNIPYLNPYYGNNRCIGHENLIVCNNRFLDYELSYKTFSNLINKDIIDKQNKQKEDNDNKKEKINNQEHFLDKSIKFLQKIYIPLIIVIVTSFVTFGICSVIFRKVKHGI